MRRVFPWVPLPTLILGIMSLVHSDLSVTGLPNLLLGIQVGLDEVGRAFLLLISGIWLIAGLYSRNYFSSFNQERLFRFYFLITYSGTIGLTIAQDAPTFYSGYALMTIGGYGLIIHSKTQAALVAGRVYIVVALFGEMLTLAGLIIAASSANTFSIQDIALSVRDSSMGSWSFWLIFLGFGTKVGLVPLHFWLPRSYYWAPLPAVAVLSGAMTKAGVLGWLRFLHFSDSSMASIIVIGAGALMAFYGVVFGLVQTRAKTTLAFSSLSQMGYLTMAFGTMLEPLAISNKSIAAILAFAFHHGVTKVALFLGLGILAYYHGESIFRRILFLSMVFCSMALIGFPWTGGAYAKFLLKEAGAMDGMWHLISNPLMIAGSIGTTLLMLRFLVLCFRGDHDQVQPSRQIFVWALSFLFVLLGAWILPNLLFVLEIEADLVHSFTESFKSYLPIAVGSVIAVPLTYKIWIKHSELTPRPFDTVLQKGYKAVWEDFPRKLDRSVALLTRIVYLFGQSFRIERKASWAVDFARRVHTSWILGCALFMTIGILLWAFLLGGEM